MSRPSKGRRVSSPSRCRPVRRAVVVLAGTSLDDRNEALGQPAHDPAGGRPRRSAAGLACGIQRRLRRPSARLRRCVSGRQRSPPRSPSSACRCPRPTTSSAASGRPSTRCSAASRRRSSASGRSSTTRATSCVRRWRCTRPSSSWRSAMRRPRRSGGLRSRRRSRRSTASARSPRTCSYWHVRRRASWRCTCEPCGSPTCSAVFGSDSRPGSTAQGARSWSSRPTA